MSEDSPRIDTGGGAYIAGNVYTGGGDFVAGDKYEIRPPSRAQARARRDQLTLLEKVRRFWVQGVLEKSLHNHLLIELGMESRPEMVDHPWAALVELSEQQAASLPQRKPIAEVFEESGKALLILGDPGSGKTISLLELARDLLDRAQADPAQPIPVVLNLSTWSQRHPDFDDWVVKELRAKYQVPKKIGRDWLDHHELLPLLDGLDEMPAAQQGACVAAINRFGETHGLSGIAVCSRIGEYRSLETRLKMGAAIFLQPLTGSQVKAYLENTGEDLAGLLRALENEPDLLELARTPLMLSVMAMVYRNAAPERLEGAGTGGQSHRQHIFDAFIRRVLARRVEGLQYPPGKQLQWLVWLARQMEAHSLSLFLMEALQPDWLDSPSKIRWYAVASRALSGLILGLGIGVLGFSNPLILLYGPAIGIAGGLISGLIAARQFTSQGTEPPTGTQKTWRERLPAVGLGVGAPAGLIVGVLGFSVVALGVLRDPEEIVLWQRLLGAVGFGLIGGLIGAVTMGVMLGLIFELVFGRRLRWQRPQEDIRTVDALKWSWAGSLRSAGRGAWLGALLGPVIGTPIGLSATGEPLEFVFFLPLICCFSALLTGLLGAIVAAVIGGLQGVEIPQKSVPNQGIWLSARNALIAGGLVGLLLGLPFAVFSQEPLAGRLESLVSGLPIAFMVAVFFGLLDFIQHFTLRFILWRNDRMPWRYARFLDQAADRIFLRKVGGGYIFVHRLLQEHIACMDVAAFLQKEG